MNTANMSQTNPNRSVRLEKIKNTIKKIMLWTVGIIGALIVLAVAYQILQYLFVGAVLLIAWLGPRRWWW